MYDVALIYLLKRLQDANFKETPDQASMYECKTFADCANKIFIAYLQNQLKSIQRLDFVWDIYIPNSLKNSTRENRPRCN